MKLIKLALLQLNSGSDMTHNISRIELMIREAAEKGAEFVATPENSFLMKSPEENSEIYTQSEHPGVKSACFLAHELKIWILIGSIYCKAENGNLSYNRSLIINPQGEIIASYDKIHLFDVDVPNDRSYRESEKILAGNKAIIANLKEAALGLTICYDVRFPHLYRTLAKIGANIIAVPAAFTKNTGEAHWHILLRARAIENSCFIIAPAQTGIHSANRMTYGHSLIVDPWGKIIADGKEGEKIVMAEIDLSEVERVRSKLPSLYHDRVFLPTSA